MEVKNVIGDNSPEDLENIRVQRSIARTFIRKDEDV